MKLRQIRHIASIFALLVTFLIITFSRHIGPALFQSHDNASYKVARVVDGDTIEISNGDTVRYIGIDTPETRERNGSGWVYNPMPYAEEAKEFNKQLVQGKSIRLEFDAQKKDRYNRVLAYAYSGDKMVNLEMVRQGLAMIYTYPPNVKYTQNFLEAQKEARDNRRGFWQGLEENKIPPSKAKDNIGRVMMVESEVTGTHITEKLLILKFKDKFQVVIYKNNIPSSLKTMIRSPDQYFKGKIIKAYGLIKEYKGHPEMVLHDLSQLELLED